MKLLDNTNYNPNQLFDGLLEYFALKHDAALADKLGIHPPIISKMRHRTLVVGPNLMLRIHEETNWPVRKIKEMMGVIEPENFGASVIRLPSGTIIDLAVPDAFHWRLEDLAERMARTACLSSDTKWVHSLSLAQHALRVLTAKEMQNIDALDPNEALKVLLEDIDKAILGVDADVGLRGMLNPYGTKVRSKIKDAIYRQFGLFDDASQTTGIDPTTMRVLASEAVHCIGWSDSNLKQLLKYQSPILTNDPLTIATKTVPWEPWDPAQAKNRYLAKLKECLEQSKKKVHLDVSSTVSTVAIAA